MSSNYCGCTDTSLICNGCPIQLDYECVIYNKANNSIAALSNLGLTNGATLKLFAESVDLKLGQLNVPSFALNCLRQTYNINNLKQFAEAVDTSICGLKADVAQAVAGSVIPITTVQTNSMSLLADGTQFHTLTANVKISAAINNLVSILSDGLYSAPQTLSINYTTKELTISQGNTVSLASLVCGVGGFLGNTASDPAFALDGQYWWNTTSTQLKIKLAGVVKVISTI